MKQTNIQGLLKQSSPEPKEAFVRRDRESKPHHLKLPNFYGAEGQPFLVRCPECEKENYAPAVASGTCAWCGFRVLGTEEKSI